MRPATIELACRYWYPGDDPGDQWRWHRYTDRVTVDIPTAHGESTWFHLPAPFFTVNAAWTWRVHLVNERGRTYLHLKTPDGYAPVLHADFRLSELWSQATFDPEMGYGAHRMMRGPWWLRWRCPDANDLRGRIVAKVDDVLDAIEDDALDAAREHLAQMRREMILATLGGKT